MRSYFMVAVAKYAFCSICMLALLGSRSCYPTSEWLRITYGHQEVINVVVVEQHTKKTVELKWIYI